LSELKEEEEHKEDAVEGMFSIVALPEPPILKERKQ